MVFAALLAETAVAVLVAGSLAAWSRHQFASRKASAHSTER
ncbi:MAG: hypothetical protein WCA46_11280 [Actinocatenispora sp.]